MRHLLVLSVATFALFAGGVATAATARMRITPHDFLVPPNGVQALTVDARDDRNAPISGTVDWSVRPASAGRIGAGGVFVAGGTPGEAVLRASLASGGRTLVAWAHVRIGEPGGSRAASRLLMVVPRQARIAANGTQLFTAQPLDASALSGDLTWRVIPPSAGHVDASGLFTASGSAAQCEVVAVTHDASGRAVGVGGARVQVTAAGGAGGPGTSGRIETRFRLLPARAVVSPGESRQFTTTLATDSPATVTWSVQPVSLGTVGLDGTFTASATASGGGVVVATATMPNGRIVHAAAAVQISQGAARGLGITPHFLRVPAGGTADLQITGMPAGASSGGQVRWVVKPETGGTITPSGTVGIFTAGTIRGQVSIEAHVSGPAGRERVLTAVVQVVDATRVLDTAPVVTLEGPSSVHVNQTATFHLAASTMGSGDLTGVQLDWMVVPATAGQVNAVSGRRASVQFRASMAGACVLTATATLNGVTRTVSKEIIVTP